LAPKSSTSDKDEYYHKHIDFRVPYTEWLLIKKVSRAHGQKVAEFVRSIVREKLTPLIDEMRIKPEQREALRWSLVREEAASVEDLMNLRATIERRIITWKKQFDNLISGPDYPNEWIKDWIDDQEWWLAEMEKKNQTLKTIDKDDRAQILIERRIEEGKKILQELRDELEFYLSRSDQ